MSPARRRRVFGRLWPSGRNTAARTPFVLLVVVLLAGGLISLLLLNAAVNQGAFQLAKLKRETTDLTDQEQALQQEVDQESAPDALERRARELGMVPGGTPAFLGPDGRVVGVPGDTGAAPDAATPPAADLPSPADASVAPAPSAAAPPRRQPGRPAVPQPARTTGR